MHVFSLHEQRIEERGKAGKSTPSTTHALLGLSSRRAFRQDKGYGRGWVVWGLKAVGPQEASEGPGLLLLPSQVVHNCHRSLSGSVKVKRGPALAGPTDRRTYQRQWWSRPGTVFLQVAQYRLWL